MNERLIHTPEGVRDIYGAECRKKRAIMDKLQEVMHLYHYDEIETPTLEFFDIFSGDKGTAMSSEMYKCFDRENNTLVMRPDMTPSIARCVSKYFSNEKHHIRLWYQGQAFKNVSRLQGKLNEFTQLGAELIGDDTSAADGEIVSMMIDCLLAAGLSEFQVSIGQVDYFKGLVEEAGLGKEAISKLITAIQNKNTFAIKNICKEEGLNDTLSRAFVGMTNEYGGLEILQRAKEMVSNKKSLKAIDRLEKLYHIMEYYDYNGYISIDLGMLSEYKYYTGVIFKGYTYGSGAPVVTGGRYNDLVKQFGVDAPSVGFAFLVDELMMALLHQKVSVLEKEAAVMILYDTKLEREATKLAKQFRGRKQVTQLTRKSSRSTIEEYIGHCKKHGITKMLCMLKNGEQVKVIDVDKGTENTIKISEITGGAL